MIIDKRRPSDPVGGTSYFPGGERAVGYFLEPDPETWDWSPPNNLRSMARTSAKKRNSGPRVTLVGIPNWAPARPYTRGMCVVTVKGCNARATFYPNNGWLGRGDRGGLTEAVLSSILIGAAPPEMGGVWSGIKLPTNLVNRVQTELLVKVAKQDVNLGNNLVEARQSVKMIGLRLVQILKIYSAVKRMNVREVFRLIGRQPGGRRFTSPQDLWLETIYGWMPYVNDLYTATQIAEEGFKETPAMLLKATRQVSMGLGSPKGGISGSPLEVDGSGSLSVRAQGYWKIRDIQMRQYQRIGLTNPAQWAWEALPFSFLIDWVLPVGNFLTALTANQGLTFVDGCLSCQLRYKATVSKFNGIPSTGGPFVDQSLQAALDGFVFQRFGMSNPKAQVYVKSPFSATHVANGLALLSQLLKGRR